MPRREKVNRSRACLCISPASHAHYVKLPMTRQRLVAAATVPSSEIEAKDDQNSGGALEVA